MFSGDLHVPASLAPPASPVAETRGPLEALLAGWKANPQTAQCIEASWTRPPRPGRLGSWPEGLHGRVRAALDAASLGRPYDHQADAVARALAGRPVVVSTPTASGKSLCLHLPVLDALARNPQARALYLLPTKALSRDQEASLVRLAQAVDPTIGVAVFDGDTPASARHRIRDRARIILTNPDMLHAGILPQHASWSSFLSGLTHLVVDEVHAYRGIFGSHVANVIRRLRRVAAWHGAHPLPLGASATIADAAGHFARLTGAEDPVEICRSGAPRGALHAVLYNPPIVNSSLGVRASALKEASRLTTQLMARGLRTICFCRTRLEVEVLLRYLRRSATRAGLSADSVQGYRGGYLPDLRRSIEAGLRSGEVRTVVSTSALELGIDIGALDACVLVGYPGSVASTWQRAGRAGRRERASLMLMVATSRALDQYVIRTPDAVQAERVEHARCDPDNLLVLLEHARCAAAELPLAHGEGFGGAEQQAFDAVVEHLRAEGELAPTAAGLRFAGEPFPANRMGLRGAPGENFVVISRDAGGEEVIAEVDRHGAALYLHPQAIYSVGGGLFHVDHLDWDGQRAWVRPLKPDYFTDAITHLQVSVLELSGVRALGAGEAGRGDVQVTERVVGFKKIKFQTHENIGYGDVDLPPSELVTQAVWLSVSADAVGIPHAGIADALRGVGHALHHLMAWRLMCDSADIGRSVQLPDPAADSDREGDSVLLPTLYLYDRMPGGVGLAIAAYERLPELLAEAAGLLRSCGCEAGCPACVGPVATVAQSGPEISLRPTALRLVQALLETPS